MQPGEWRVEEWQMRKFRSMADVDDLKTKLLLELSRLDVALDEYVTLPAKKKVPVSST